MESRYEKTNRRRTQGHGSWRDFKMICFLLRRARRRRSGGDGGIIVTLTLDLFCLRAGLAFCVEGISPTLPAKGESMGSATTADSRGGFNDGVTVSRCLCTPFPRITQQLHYAPSWWSIPLFPSRGEHCALLVLVPFLRHHSASLAAGQTTGSYTVWG